MTTPTPGSGPFTSPDPLLPAAGRPALDDRLAAGAVPTSPVSVTPGAPPADPRLASRDPHRAPDLGGDAQRSGERRKHRTPLGWLPWAALAGILALLALALLAGSLGGDDSSSTARSGSSTATGGGAPAAPTSGPLRAGSTDLLADPAGIKAVVGQPATGQGVLVESVVADEGFWVGSSAQSRVFVFLTPEARQSAGESGFQVTAGQRVELTGTVSTLEGGPDTLGVTESEGATQLVQQGAYVRADSVRLS